MVTYLFTAILLLSVLAVALYFWQKPANRQELGGIEAEPLRLPPSDSRGLFIGSAADETANAPLAPDAMATADPAALIERARHNDKTALPDAIKHEERAIYDEVLDLLVEHADSDPKLLSLVSYVVTNELPVNKPLAEAVIASWQQEPGRATTAKMLHIAALADDAALYQGAVKTALQCWREGRLSDIAPVELRALFDGEFWVLSSATRTTGAGFMLKRTLAQARRELESPR
jgi:hypothetical protein